jgi:hypothetical protein
LQSSRESSKPLQSEVVSASSSKFLVAISKALDIHSYDFSKEEIRVMLIMHNIMHD